MWPHDDSCIITANDVLITVSPPHRQSHCLHHEACRCVDVFADTGHLSVISGLPLGSVSDAAGPAELWTEQGLEKLSCPLFLRSHSGTVNGFTFSVVFLMQYLGKWYEIEKLPATYEKGTCIETNYSLRPDKTIRVVYVRTRSVIYTETICILVLEMDES